MAVVHDTTMDFLSRQPAYEHEKLYEFDFEPPPGTPRTNVVTEQVNLQIQDIRGREKEFTLEKNGFQLVEFDCGMAYTDFADEVVTREKYVPVAAAFLKKFLGAERLQVDSVAIRRRHPDYPIYKGEEYVHHQPSSLAHVDTTVQGTKHVIETGNPAEGSELVKQRHQFVNLWKPLRGPIRDWPLAFCDPATMDPEVDLEARDQLQTTGVVEGYYVYYATRQAWYFVSDQQENEAWIFLQSDSTAGAMQGIAHTSFPYKSNDQPTLPRESIEMRALVFY